MEIPRSLKHLVQKVMRGFYPIEHVIVVDLLIRKQLIKEDEIIDLLKFERKHLRAILALLKSDKLIKIKLRMETGVDGKASRQNYYYINYKAFVNVVKYKLDHMRKKIELEERDLTSRASFVCNDCQNTFTDLEVHQLFDATTGELRCSFCSGEVKEDPNHMPKADSRLLLAKFNQMMEPLYLLLKDVEDIRLSSDLLEPEIEVKPEPGLQSAQNSANNSLGGKQWTDKNRAIISEYENSVFNEQQNYTVKIHDSSNSDVVGHELESVVVKKEQPSWMLESTVSNINNNLSESLPPISIKTNSKQYIPKINPIISSNTDNEPSKEILETLLIHEKQQENSNATSILLNDNTNDIHNFDSIDNNEEDVIMSDEEEDDTETHTPMVTVGHQSIPLSDINDEIISQMNEEEKEEYIRLTQQVYAHMYDI